MALPSPACLVKDGGGAFVSTDGGVNVTPGNVIVIKLESQSFVDSWHIECATTDDLGVAATVTASLTIDPLNRTATFTLPAGVGRTYRFLSRVNNGVDVNGVQRPDWETTFCLYSVTAQNRRTISLDEGLESGPFGWLVPINDLIRNPSPGSGETNTTSNVGAGAQLAKPKSGVDFPFRTLVGINGTTVTQLTDTVTIDGSGIPDVTGHEGDVLRVVSGVAAWDDAAEVPNGSAGDYVVLDGLGGLTTAAGPGGGSGEVNTASNVGGGAGVFKDKNGFDLRFKSLVAGTGVTITPGTDTIQLDATGAGGGEVNTASNVGAGSQVFKQKSGVDLQFRSLVAGAGIQLTQNTNDITIVSSAPPGGSDNQFQYNNAGVLDGASGMTYDEATNRPQMVNGWYLAAGANRMLFAGTPTANRTWTWPDATDVVVGRNTTDTLTNKTLDSALNTLISTSQATGDLLKNDGTKYTRFPRGSALSYLRVNAAGTDLEWGSVSGGAASSGVAGTVQLSNGAGGFTGATNVLGGTGFLSISTAGATVASSGNFRLEANGTIKFYNGSSTVTGLTVTSGNTMYVGGNSSYTEQPANTHLRAGSNLYIGIGNSTGVLCQGNATNVTSTALYANNQAQVNITSNGAFFTPAGTSAMDVNNAGVSTAVPLFGLAVPMRLGYRSVTISSSPKTVTFGEYDYPMIHFTGSWVTAPTVVFPATSGAFWFVSVGSGLLEGIAVAGINIPVNSGAIVFVDALGITRVIK